MTLKRQNVSSERVCLFATVWKRAVYKFTHRYTNYLFCAGKLIALFLFWSFCFILIFNLSSLLSSQNSSLPIKTKKRNSTTMLFCFSIQCFLEVYTCVLHCCTVPCVCTGTHTDTQELLNKSKWMCSFHISCTLKLHGNHNIFNKLLQKNVLLIKLFYVHYLSSTLFGYQQEMYWRLKVTHKWIIYSPSCGFNPVWCSSVHFMNLNGKRKAFRFLIFLY